MTDINIGEITEALNDKSDRDMRNVDNTAGADAVIEYQVPTADNNYTWYRKYKSGWVEQGGLFNVSSNASGTNNTVNLPITMTDTNYTAIPGLHSVTNDTGIYLFVKTKSTTSVIFMSNMAIDDLQGQNWMVCGIAAS